jgi:hypothetical protein
MDQTINWDYIMIHFSTITIPDLKMIKSQSQS